MKTETNRSKLQSKRFLNKSRSSVQVTKPSKALSVCWRTAVTYVSRSLATGSMSQEPALKLLIWSVAKH